MPKHTIRYGICDASGHRGSTWRCWISKGTGKNDIYFANRTLVRALKVSLHQDGNWHLAYEYNFYRDRLGGPGSRNTDRFIERWKRPREVFAGFTLAIRLIIPKVGIDTPYNPDNFKTHVWIPNATKESATEIYLFIQRSGTALSGSWPGQMSMNTKLVGTLNLDNGDIVWIVYKEIPMPQLPSQTVRPNFSKGTSKKDFFGKVMRMLSVKFNADGSLELYDLPGEVLPKGWCEHLWFWYIWIKERVQKSPHM